MPRSAPPVSSCDPAGRKVIQSVREKIPSRGHPSASRHANLPAALLAMIMRLSKRMFWPLHGHDTQDADPGQGQGGHCPISAANARRPAAWRDRSSAGPYYNLEHDAGAPAGRPYSGYNALRSVARRAINRTDTVLGLYNTRVFEPFDVAASPRRGKSRRRSRQLLRDRQTRIDAPFDMERLTRPSRSNNSLGDPSGGPPTRRAAWGSL